MTRAQVWRNRIIALAILCAIVGGIASIVNSSCTPQDISTEEPIKHVSKDVHLWGDVVTFVAVGDNLPEADIGSFADSKAGSIGDGEYDYSAVFDGVRERVQDADLAYMKEETHIGGSSIGPHGYPAFNTTDEMADAIVEAGFDLVGSATNHSYDWGSYGAVDHSCEVWADKDVEFTGTARSKDEASQLALIERNGITFALLDYTYGVNGYSAGDLPSYTVNIIDEDRITEDVERAKTAADVVLVAMHWGTEKQTEPDADQLRYAQLLADLGVDVVLGSHTHTIGPLEWVEGKDGNKTLVAYSLGNFLSNHQNQHVYNQIEGMLSCTFFREGPDDPVQIEDVTWVPLVNHADVDGSFCVYPLADYTDEMASMHKALGELEDPVGELKSFTKDVIGDAFPIDD
ncbi:MAG: CapA family protein [Eggerthellaceae bacterium]|nr:CapA family protein [Eggerthellaceae bacterium]